MSIWDSMYAGYSFEPPRIGDDIRVSRPLIPVGNLASVNGVNGHAVRNFAANTSYLTTPAPLWTGGPLSVSLWFRMSPPSSASPMLIWQNDDSLVIKFSRGGRSATIRAHAGITVATPMVRSLVWHHVLVTHDGSMSNFYIDGDLLATWEATPGPITATGTFIGADPTNFLMGEMDSLYFFSSVIPGDSFPDLVTGFPAGA